MKFILALCVLLFSSSESFSQKNSSKDELKVVIIRHAEKPNAGDNLCPKGLNRALALPAVLDTITGVPDYTYIPKVNTGNTTLAVRMLQTVTPFAVAHNLILNTSFKNDDVKGVAADILKKSGVVLMVWEHSNIPDLAKALGVKNKLKWKDEDFGSIWIIEFKKKSAAPDVRIEQENLNPKGACN
jgi:hypothetical protein